MELTFARKTLKKKLCTAVADRAAAMVGTKASKEKKAHTSRFTSCHCIIHQEDLCARFLGF